MYEMFYHFLAFSKHINSGMFFSFFFSLSHPERLKRTGCDWSFKVEIELTVRGCIQSAQPTEWHCPKVSTNMIFKLKSECVMDWISLASHSLGWQFPFFFFSISIKNSLIFIQNRRHEGKMWRTNYLAQIWGRWSSHGGFTVTNSADMFSGNTVMLWWWFHASVLVNGDFFAATTWGNSWKMLFFFWKPVGPQKQQPLTRNVTT